MQKIFPRKLEVFIEKSKDRENIYAVSQLIGYQKHPSIKNKLIVDEAVKEIVEKIFNLYANGKGSKDIVSYLNAKKYLSPTGYRKTGIVQDEKKTKYDWNEVTLCNMLKNEVYLGNTIQNKKTVVSYKVKKIREVEKENQIRVNHTHEPIIEKDTFEKVQCILEKRGTNAKAKYDYLLRGLLYCHHCKRKLQIVRKSNAKRNTKAHPYITCSNYKERNCYPLSINYEKFENYIIYKIKEIAKLNVDREILYSVYENYQNKSRNSQEDSIKKIEQLEKSILEINNNLDKMYVDKLKNVMTEEDYIRISNKFILDRTKLTKQKEQFEQKLMKEQETVGIKNKEKEERDEVIDNFLKFEPIEKIDLYRLIRKIEIDKDKNVYLYFNFSKLHFYDSMIKMDREDKDSNLQQG